MLTRRSSSKNFVSMMTLPVRTLAGIIWDSGAASIKDCQVFVELGITKPNSKNHSSRHCPLKKTFCSRRNFSICSAEEKFSSRDTALHLRIFLGTRASCSTPGTDRSSVPCQSIFPVSASRRFIQFSLKPLRISLARSSLADMMRRPPPAALPRWLCGASQTVPRNRGQPQPGRTPQQEDPLLPRRHDSPPTVNFCLHGTQESANHDLKTREWQVNRNPQVTSWSSLFY